MEALKNNKATKLAYPFIETIMEQYKTPPIARRKGNAEGTCLARLFSIPYTIETPTVAENSGVF